MNVLAEAGSIVRRVCPRCGLIAALPVIGALVLALPSGAVPGAAAPGVAAAPIPDAEYKVFDDDLRRGLSNEDFRFHTSRDLRWVTSDQKAGFAYCRLAGEASPAAWVFRMPRRMRLTRDGRFSRLDGWPRITGRFSADGSKIFVRFQHRAFTPRNGVRCPALDRSFEALVYLPAGDYAGSTAQGHPISFTLGGPGRTLVSKLAFGVTLPCEPTGSVTHTFADLSGKVDAASYDPPFGFELRTGDQPFGGGSRGATVMGELSGATVSGELWAYWQPPEPDYDNWDPTTDTSPQSCETPDAGVPFTAQLIRGAPGT